MARRPRKGPKQVETLTHDEARRKNIPTAELQSVAQRAEEVDPFEPVTYPREDPLPYGETRSRDEDLDPQIIWKGATLRLSPDQIAQLTETGRLEIGDAQLVWRGKDQQDWSDLVVQAPPLYIQEKIHPKAIIGDLKRQTKDRREAEASIPDLFADFNGIDPEARTEFYQHDQNWQNRMILGDSLQVMASLAEREALRGQVQCIYFDPPYGIKFNSNWQVSTRSRDVRDGKLDQITREPEQVKAFRDTWKDGIHSYLTYLRDRLTAMRDLLTESGSIFVQIGDENVHRVRALMDEVFGEENFVSEIVFQKTSGAGSPAIGTNTIAGTYDVIVWFARRKEQIKYRQPYRDKIYGEDGTHQYRHEEDETGNRTLIGRNGIPDKSRRILRFDQFTSQSGATTTQQPVPLTGEFYEVRKGGWKTNVLGAKRLLEANRLAALGRTLCYVRYLDDFAAIPINNLWSDTRISGFGDEKMYVVQTSPKVIARCILMSTDPGDLVLDPTCGSGTTATVAEQWGRRWITIDTSRIAVALARSRLMGARYPYCLLADSPEGQAKEGY